VGLVLIAVGAVVVIVAVALAMRARNEQLERHRAEANELRQKPTCRTPRRKSVARPRRSRLSTLTASEQPPQ
jgi:Tfp pilus assembly protein PilO